MKYIPLMLFILANSAGAQSVKPYSVSADLHEVSNVKAFRKAVKIGAEHERMLAKNLFVCAPKGDKQLYWVYGRNDYLNLPSFVTSDAVLQLYHVFFDSTLRSVEENALYSHLTRLTRAMLTESESQLKTATDPRVKRAGLKNVAFFSVASKLLGRFASIPAQADSMARVDLGLIEQHAGFKVGGIFPYQLDYSQFRPRGHYTKSPKLTRFFKTMMWYGLAPFSTRIRTAAGVKRMDEQILEALLIVRSLHTSDWQAIYEPTTLYAGTANDLTPAEWLAVANSVFGSNAPIAGLADSSKYDALIAALEAKRKPRIVSKRRGNDLADGPQMRFMGQRAIPDSEILQRLSGDERFPRGLDVMAVLGSERARQILDASPQLYNPKGWAQYGAERAKLIQEFAAVPRATWNSNLYWSWLYALKALLDPTPAGYPSFMRNRAWQDKSLQTCLASWTELRHDTILYGQQSVAEAGDGEEPPFVPGYVEPNVPFFNRLIFLTRQSHKGLQARKLLDPEFAKQFAEFEDLLAFLKSVAERELRNEKLSKTEHERIRHIEGDLEGMTMRVMEKAGNFKALTQDDLDMALVADVHTGADRALTEGVGHAYDIIAIVPVEGKLYLSRGGVFSYYEFDVPISRRLTDQEWKKELGAGKTPTPPAWISTFFVNKKATDRAE